MNKQLIFNVLNTDLTDEDKLELIRLVVTDDDYIALDEAQDSLVAAGVRDAALGLEAAGAIVHASHAVNKYGWPFRGDLYDSELRLRLNDWSHVLRDGRHTVYTA